MRRREKNKEKKEEKKESLGQVRQGCMNDTYYYTEFVTYIL